MKIKYFLPIIALTSLGAFCWTAMAQQPDVKKQPDRIAQMEKKQAEISERVGMTSCLEISDLANEEFVAKAVENGLIIETTLDEVEAALKSAAKTPDNQDDIAAMRLAHWGSYRFFIDEMPFVSVPEN